MRDKPHIVLLSTGGTIVSSGNSATQLTGYSLQGVTVGDLVAQIPGIHEAARLTFETICNIDSMNLTGDIWWRLATRIEELAADPDIDGFVITHGTDTMEETGFYLHLVLSTTKPVVMTGAMRPSTAISADGPLNLLNAVRTAASPQAAGKGVMLVLNDRILPARDATKCDSTNAATFRSDNSGMLGMIAGSHVAFFLEPTLRHTSGSEFQIVPPPLPKVEILYSHADMDGGLVQAAVALGARGIVYAGMGNGSIHQGCEPALVAAARSGVVIVRASRSVSGMTVEGLPRWQQAGFIPAGSLSPQKARILLQCALTVTSDIREIRRIFQTY